MTNEHPSRFLHTLSLGRLMRLGQNAAKNGVKKATKHSLLRPFMLGALALGLVSCSFVPTLKDDGFLVPGQFKESKARTDGTQAPQALSALNPLKNQAASVDPMVEKNGKRAFDDKRGALMPSDWWRMLGDPLLNQLEDKLLANNVSVLSLSAQVRVAQASLKQAEASLFPTLNVNMSASRAANQLSVPKGTSYSLSAPMSWELDVWGRIDALTQFASSNAQASEFDLSQAKVSVQALLVQSYVSFLTASGQEALLQRTVAVYEKSLALTLARYKAGVVSSADVAQARTQLKSTQAQWQDVILQRKQIEHALATLTGVVPAQLKLDLEAHAWPKAALAPSSNRWDSSALKALPQVPALPEVLVLEVLQFRPDIQAAKRRVEAANAQLGVARSAFFPPLVLSASAGYRNTDLASLVSAPNQAWSIGPSLVLPLFDGGLRQAAKESAQAQLDNALLNYRQVVLNAFQEIEDNLVAREQLSLMEGSWADAAQSASRNLEVVYAQYQAGVVPYSSVVSAQSALLGAQRSLLDMRSRQLLAWNQLQKNTFVESPTVQVKF